jgi:hypothetical protein
MKHRWAALGLVLALSALMTSTASAQTGSGQQGQRGPGPLGQNYPNPFNPETTIPFAVGYDEGNPPVCTDPSRVYRVSLRVYNLLAQLVAIPILQGGGESRGRPVQNLQLPCGEYTAFWDGTSVGSSRQVASGIYMYRLEIDGKPYTRKMLVTK